MKEYIVNRSGQTPSLEEVPNEKIKIYDSIEDAQSDLSNIAENEIVATMAGESEGVALPEYELKAVETGTIVNSATAIGQMDYSVTFQEEQPDTNYIIEFRTTYAGKSICLSSKSTTGFSVHTFIHIANAPSVTFTWTMYRVALKGD